MILNISDNHLVVFDLDDTLYKEIDYLKSAYKQIAHQLQKEIDKNVYEEMLYLWFSRKNVFSLIKEKYSLNQSLSDLVLQYRHHKPSIQLLSGAKTLLTTLVNRKIPIGLITDGRSRSQRNKITALGVESFFCKILISEEFGSEKPDCRNFQYFMDNFDATEFIYIGDNFQKDFISPNKLGWTTIGLLDDGRNIHKQNINIGKEYLPKYTISSLQEIILKENYFS